MTVLLDLNTAAFWDRSLFAVGGYPAHRRVFTSIFGPYPLHNSGIPHPPL